MTKEKFQAYLLVQKSGVTNMWDVNQVIKLSAGILTEENCLDIMKNYTKYKEEFGE